MESRKLVLGVVGVVLFTATSWAGKLPDGLIDPRQLSINGNACSGGAGARSKINSRTGEYLVSYDLFEAVPSEGASSERKTCNLALPISVPQGYKLVISKTELRSQVELTKNTKVRITNETFFAGGRGKPLQRDVIAKKNISQKVVLTSKEKVESLCGQDVNLRANTALIINRGSSVSRNRGQVQLLKMVLSLVRCSR